MYSPIVIIHCHLQMAMYAHHPIPLLVRSYGGAAVRPDFFVVLMCAHRRWPWPLLLGEDTQGEWSTLRSISKNMCVPPVPKDFTGAEHRLAKVKQFFFLVFVFGLVLRHHLSPSRFLLMAIIGDMASACSQAFVGPFPEDSKVV